MSQYVSVCEAPEPPGGGVLEFVRMPSDPSEGLFLSFPSLEITHDGSLIGSWRFDAVEGEGVKCRVVSKETGHVSTWTEALVPPPFAKPVPEPNIPMSLLGVLIIGIGVWCMLRR